MFENSTKAFGNKLKNPIDILVDAIYHKYSIKITVEWNLNFRAKFLLNVTKNRHFLLGVSFRRLIFVLVISENDDSQELQAVVKALSLVIYGQLKSS